jgi:hypothetical protein
MLMYTIFFFLWRCNPTQVMISSSQRPLPDNTQHSQQTNIHAPGGIQIHDLSRQAVALDRAATGTGIYQMYRLKFTQCLKCYKILINITF